MRRRSKSYKWAHFDHDDDDGDSDLPAITEREAFSLAEHLEQQWVQRWYDEPSSQTWWTRLYENLWDMSADLPEEQDPDHSYLRDYMRGQCRGMLAIRDSARAAYDDASPLMPQNAPSTLAYIHGVGAFALRFWTVSG